MKNPLLVTGSHRSGTTWIGEMLCAGGDYTYVHEPFNSTKRPRLLDVTIPGDYTCVDSSNAHFYKDSVARLLDYGFPLVENLRSSSKPVDWAKAIREDLRLRKAKKIMRPLLIKDPLALLSTPWLAEEFGMDVLILVRHPAAFASSLLRLNWQYDFGYLQSQPQVLDGLFVDHAEEIRHFAEHPQPLIDQATFLWRLLYGLVAKWQSEHSEWQIEKYEDFASNPSSKFAALYEQLGLNYGAAAQSQIDKFSDKDNSSDVSPGDKGSTKRDSRSARDTWMNRLTEQQIDTVRAATQEISSLYYADDEWGTSNSNHGEAT